MKTVAQAFLVGIFSIILVVAVSAIATLAQSEEKPPAQDVRPICGCDFAARYRDHEQCKRGNVKPDDGKGKER